MFMRLGATQPQTKTYEYIRPDVPSQKADASNTSAPPEVKSNHQSLERNLGVHGFEDRQTSLSEAPVLHLDPSNDDSDHDMQIGLSSSNSVESGDFPDPGVEMLERTDGPGYGKLLLNLFPSAADYHVLLMLMLTLADFL